jgi:hypothetical protein
LRLIHEYLLGRVKAAENIDWQPAQGLIVGGLGVGVRRKGTLSPHTNL